mmetsp:Transcript_3162/g.8714  ORF Transcript_3162/g.8714 Transcript_3162/m.8714 type:complete len:282 (-) Transcript_3162:282-1127(-)
MASMSSLGGLQSCCVEHACPAHHIRSACRSCFSRPAVRHAERASANGTRPCCQWRGCATSRACTRGAGRQRARACTQGAGGRGPISTFSPGPYLLRWAVIAGGPCSCGFDAPQLNARRALPDCWRAQPDCWHAMPAAQPGSHRGGSDGGLGYTSGACQRPSSGTDACWRHRPLSESACFIARVSPLDLTVQADRRLFSRVRHPSFGWRRLVSLRAWHQLCDAAISARCHCIAPGSKRPCRRVNLYSGRLSGCDRPRAECCTRRGGRCAIRCYGCSDRAPQR